MCWHSSLCHREGLDVSNKTWWSCWHGLLGHRDTQTLSSNGPWADSSVLGLLGFLKLLKQILLLLLLYYIILYYIILYYIILLSLLVVVLVFFLPTLFSCYNALPLQEIASNFKTTDGYVYLLKNCSMTQATRLTSYKSSV